MNLLELVRHDLPGLLPFGPTTMRPIDEGFSERYLTVPENTSEIHLPLAVESLLDEVNELLTRCVALERYKQEMEEKALSFFLAHKRDRAQLEIRQEAAEKEAQFNDTSGAEEVRALELQNSKLQAVDQLKSEALESREPTSERARKRIELTGLVTGYLSPHAADEAMLQAAELERNRLWYEFQSIITEQGLLHTEVARVSSALAHAERQAAYQRERDGLRLRELEAEADALDRRKQEALRPGSPLNFVSRINEAQRMFDADFAAAVRRGPALSAGLHAVYGISLPYPPEAPNGLLAAYVVFARTASELLFSATEQSESMALAIDVRRHLLPADWERLIAGEGVVVSYETPDAAPSNARYQLRSLQVEVRGPTKHAVLGLDIAPPEVAIQPLDRTLAALDIMPNDAIGRTGRISGRTLLNRPIFGSWSLKLRHGLEAGTDVNIVINLSVVRIRNAEWADGRA
ncbi:MAG: hypothetical protein IPK33_08440 [Gemmatimonadetes bacterium]|nr:hypothetical protein [Gemmatimonadota bacterium]